VTVLFAVEELSEDTGSVSFDVTVAVLLKFPALAGLTTMVTVAVASWFSVSMLQVTVLVPLQVP
jgi:hypothetical protein